MKSGTNEICLNYCNLFSKIAVVTDNNTTSFFNNESDVGDAPLPILQFGVLQQWLQTRNLTLSPMSMHPVLQLLEQFLFCIEQVRVFKGQIQPFGTDVEEEVWFVKSSS